MDGKMEKTEKAKKIKKTIRNLIVFILLIGLTFYLIFKDQNVLEILNIAVSVKKRYILVAIIAMCLYLLGETINITRILKELGEKSTFLRNIRYTLIGFFFSSITPAASGGQPMEIYYMHKEKIAVANSTLALLVHLTSFQIVTITLGILSTILHFEIVKSGLIYLVVLGILLNSTALTLLAISIFSKRLSKGLINFAVKVLRFFRIPNIEKKQESLEKELEKYQESAVYIKEHKKLMIKTLVTTFIQVIIYYSIPYWVYLAFGFTGYNFFQIVTLQAMLYATVSGIPSPGAVGVSEGAFIEIFKGVFPATMMNSAILLNRGASFYLFVIISAIVTTITALKTKNYEVKEELNNN
jgi:uncharacterized protein (TIRG00374 family)